MMVEAGEERVCESQVNKMKRKNKAVLFLIQSTRKKPMRDEEG